MTPHYLAGETAKMMGLTLELARNRTGQQQRAWLNGYAAADRLRMDQARTPAASRLPASHLR